MGQAVLNANEIFEASAAAHGLRQYADEGMRKRFSGLIDSFNHNGPLPEWACAATVEQLSALVRRRLELARDRALYPQIADEKIERPFFVVGSGRTGTTLMQVLLALGEGCRTPLSWECRQPSPPPGLDPASEPARIALEDRYINQLINTAPGLLLSHPYVDAGAFMEVEDEDLFAVDFHTAFPWHFTQVPILPLVHHEREASLTDALRFHRQFLQHLQWKQPTQHWVCKTAQHFFELPATWEVYPDALCVWTHRDPVVFVSSLLGILQHVFTPLTGLNLRGAVAQQVVAGLQAGYEAVLRGGWIDDPRLVHVRFDDFVRDPIGTIGDIYARAELPFSAAYETRMRQWLADPAHRSDRHGKFLYSLEQFGLKEDEVRAGFAGYYERFLK